MCFLVDDGTIRYDCEVALSIGIYDDIEDRKKNEKVQRKRYSNLYF